MALAARRGGKGGYQLHGSEYKANATQIDLSAHDQIVRIDPVGGVPVVRWSIDWLLACLLGWLIE